MFSFSRKSSGRLKGVNPKLVFLCKEVIQTSPVDFGILHGVRTQLEQDKLWAQGRTAIGPIVTWTRNSKHLIQKDGYAHAIDFGVYDDGVYQNGDSPSEYKYYWQVVDEFKKRSRQLGIPIICGADWTRADLGHIELP